MHLPRGLRPSVVVALVCAFMLAFAASTWSRAGEANPPAADAAGADSRDAHPSVEQLASIGRRAFFDTSLSASGRLACASCHDPRHAFGPPNDLSVQLGGADGKQQGRRSTPSLMYLQTAIPFVERQFDHDDDGGGEEDAGPAGGLTWDGRVDTLHDQARIPLFAAHEMGNADAAAVRDRLRHTAYAEEFRRAVSASGRDVFDDPEDAVRWLTLALEAFQQSAPEFHPFSSKYDAFLRKEVTLSRQELHGLALFDDPTKGNCAQCHPNTIDVRGAFPMFTDFGHVAVGVPRNRRLPANRDPDHFDLGLCGPERTDLERHVEFCGAFITPTLRNVATRGAFFHNGAFHSLREVLEFYVQRDTRPGRWYGRGRDGKVARFDDLPKAYHDNVNAEVPFKPGPANRPRLNAREIDDLLAYLKTLTDGYVVPKK